MERNEITWTPTGEPLRVAAFMESVGQPDWNSLLEWSITDLDGFWRAVASELGVHWTRPPDDGIALADATMPGARWFPGAELNYAQHSLAQAERTPDVVAVVAVSQSRPDVTLTWQELHDEVARAAAGLRGLGVTRGDRVAAYAPNCAETLALFLATASIGAIWASCAPEFGVRAVVDRFSQIEPKVLLAVDGYRYGEKSVDRAADVASIQAALVSVEAVIHLRHLGTGPDGWGSFVADAPVESLEFASVPFDHPLYVLFSSGTTGLPKAIVHGHGGITLEHLKVLALHGDLGPNDRFFWYTTTGWMMWNYLVSGLLVGAAVVLFDGDPAAPDLSALWRIVEQTETTFFGVSAPYITACDRAGIRPAEIVDLSALRTVGSTGAPLPARGFRWVREAVGSAVHLASISGGTDVCTAFVGMSRLLPVRAGEISTRHLGCAVEAFAPDGTAVGPGTTGELVITAPMPSMPVGFWGDDQRGSAMHDAYFDVFPGVWRHGDWITFTDDGACTISGRSDATLNRGGVRLGTSDFYSLVESMPGVRDSLVVHLEDAAADESGMGRLRLFVVMEEGAPLDEEFEAAIRRTLRTELSPRHVPDVIDSIPVVPRTLSGKKLEVPVKRILEGHDPGEVVSRDSLADPGAIDWFIAEREARGAI